MVNYKMSLTILWSSYICMDCLLLGWGGTGRRSGSRRSTARSRRDC